MNYAVWGLVIGGVSVVSYLLGFVHGVQQGRVRPHVSETARPW